MSRSAPAPAVKKTSINVADALWRRVKIRAIEEGREVQAVVADALTAYLATPRKDGRR
jgi:plasmid stability protein